MIKILPLLIIPIFFLIVYSGVKNLTQNKLDDVVKVTEIQESLNPINWNMPLHTQVYRFFRPSSFDVEKIKATQQMIEEHGLEFVVKLFVREHLRL